MTKIFVLFVTLLASLTSAFAQQGQDYYCDVYNDKLEKLTVTLGLSDNWVGGDYRVSHSRYFPETKTRLHYDFVMKGEVGPMKIDTSIATTGRLMTSNEETIDEPTNEEITVPVEGYISVVKYRRHRLGKGLIGKGLIPFVNNDQPVTLKCVKEIDTICGWFCN